MRHLGQIGNHRFAVHILAKGHGDLGLALLPFIALEQIAHDDLGLDAVGHLHAHRTLARHGRKDVDALGLQGGGDVVGVGGDLLHLHAGGWMQLEPRDGRALGDVAQRHFHAKLIKRFLDGDGLRL